MLNTLEMKQQIIEELKVANDSIIREIYAVLHSSNAENNWETLPQSVRDNIEIGIQQANAGEVIAHEIVMKKYEKWLSK